MREETLERLYEKEMDRLDADLMKDLLTPEQYEQKVANLNKWLTSWQKLLQESKIRANIGSHLLIWSESCTTTA
jgi:hypothetical protein